MSKFVKIQNQFVNMDQVCGCEYKKFHAPDIALMGAESIFKIFTTDGKEIIFKNEAADVMFEFFSRIALGFTE